MTYYTRHYKLPAIEIGEAYSASKDRKRFSIIDNEIAFISDRIGTGIIDGWDMSVNEDGLLSISSGIGVIDRNVVETAGIVYADLPADIKSYIYFTRKDELSLGSLSGVSNISSVEAEDVTPPSQPQNFSQIYSIIEYLASESETNYDLILYLKNLISNKEEELSEIVDYNQIAFQWEANSEADFSHYIILKRNDVDTSSEYEKIYETSYNVYIDSNLTQNTEYFYEIIAVDISGNESEPYFFSFSTERDYRIPSSPSYLNLYPSDSKIMISWLNSSSTNVTHYKIEMQPLNYLNEADGEKIYEYIEYSYDETSNYSYAYFYDLENSRKYKVSVYSVNSGEDISDEILSEDISRIVKIENFEDAGEVANIEIRFEEDIVATNGLSGTLFWDYDISEPSGEKPLQSFMITFIENSGRYSEPIKLSKDNSFVEGDSYSFSFDTISYNDNGRIVNESMKEYTYYNILIQTITIEGVQSSGVVKNIRTPFLNPVEAVSDIEISRIGGNYLYVKWINPTGEQFSYNLISVIIEDIDTGEIIDSGIVNKKIGRVTDFTIDNELFSLNYIYTINIVSYDIFNNGGGTGSIVANYIGAESLPLVSPTGISYTSGNGSVRLQWDYIFANNQDIKYFKIYRAQFSNYISNEDFVLIAEISSVYTSYTDYTVENNVSYTYAVASVNIFGDESFYIDDEESFFPSNSTVVTPYSYGTLSSPTGLVVERSGYDAMLSWEASYGLFDGYEILRSSYNNYSFEVIGSASMSASSYTDENALLKDGENYYYMIRKYHNDVSLYINRTGLTPDNSILIGAITTNEDYSNNIIENDFVRNLLNFEDPIKEIVIEKISNHNHRYENNIDRRIELKSNFSISEWTTLDNITYVTSEDIEGASSYYVTIEGEINESYFEDENGDITAPIEYYNATLGLSPVGYYINSQDGEIVFNKGLYSTYQTSPYLSPPLITLHLRGLAEVDGTIDNDFIESLNATQVASGRLDSLQIPSINHEGRISEILIPIRLPMKSFDNLKYTLNASYEGDRNNMGSAVTFYDIIKGNGASQIISATSNGLWISDSYASRWNIKIPMDDAPHTLYKTMDGSIYALTSRDIYKSDGINLYTWGKENGLNGVGCIRDIAEDKYGNLFVSTNLGVYKMSSEDIPYLTGRWYQTPLLGIRSSSAYAIFYDEDYFDTSSEGRIIVSNEIGIFQSTDNGQSWEYSAEIENGVRIWSFIKDGDYLFALSDNSIYRKGPEDSSFNIISEMQTSICRKMKIYNGKIYLNSNIGIMSSGENADIYTSSAITMSLVFGEMDINNQKTIVTSLSLIDDKMFIGTDRRLFSLNDTFLGMVYEEQGTIIPTFFVNSDIQTIGFYYNNSTYQNVCFDEAIGNGVVVEVSNKYDIFYSRYGGWAENNFNAKTYLYQNNIYIGETEDRVSIDSSDFENIVLPEYSDLNANLETAEKYEEDVRLYLSEMINLSNNIYPEDIVWEDYSSAIVRDFYNSLERFLSQLYEEARYVEDINGNTDADGNILMVPFSLPGIYTKWIKKEMETDYKGEPVLDSNGEIKYLITDFYALINASSRTQYTTQVNVVEGVFSFGISFDRYDVLKIDIDGVTVSNIGDNSHREVEDAFEYVYSGLSSQLSQAHQINLVKLGMYINGEDIGDGESILDRTVYNKHIIPSEDMVYDDLNSTINYIERISVDEEVFSINYPSAVAYLPFIEKIIVGGYNGLLSIDINNLNIEKYEIGDIEEKWIRDIYVDNDNVYIISDNNIFYSYNGGEDWEEYVVEGLPNQIYSIGRINNILVVGGIDGIYTRILSGITSWEKASGVPSSPVLKIVSSNILYLFIDGKIYRTTEGYSFSEMTVGSGLNLIDMIHQNSAVAYVSTSEKIYTDRNSFNSAQPFLREIDISEYSNGDESFNCLSNDKNRVVIGTSNGTYFVIDGNQFSFQEYSNMCVIHKSLIINNEIWLFGGSYFKAPDIVYPIRLTLGIPI